MLHSHPELAMPRETRFVLQAWDRRRAFGDLGDPANRRAVGEWIFLRDRTLHRRLGLDAERAIARLEASPPELGALLAACFELYAEKHGKPRWGDKRPIYAARMGAVRQLFPQAQFLNVVRDPRACVASIRKLGWYAGRLAPAVDLWLRSIGAVNAWRPRLAADQLLDVRFEDLVASPRETLARIAEFTGLDGSEAALEEMLGYHGRKEVRSDRYHANLSREPDPTRIAAWRDGLAPGEIAFVESVTAAGMRQFGYEPAADGVAVPRRLVRDLHELRLRRRAGRFRRSLRRRARRLAGRPPRPDG